MNIEQAKLIQIEAFLKRLGFEPLKQMNTAYGTYLLLERKKYLHLSSMYLRMFGMTTEQKKEATFLN